MWSVTKASPLHLPLSSESELCQRRSYSQHHPSPAVLCLPLGSDKLRAWKLNIKLTTAPWKYIHWSACFYHWQVQKVMQSVWQYYGKDPKKRWMLLTKQFFLFVCLFFFHQKQPPNCPPVSMPQRWQPVAYKLLHSCERKHSSICQRKGENGRIIVMINQQVLTSTLTNIAPSGKVDSNGWIHGSLSDRLKGDFLLFFHCLLVHRFAKLSSQAQWLLSLTAWFNMLNLP